MVYTAINHDYHGISHDFLLPILINCIPACRIQLLWFLRFPTALRRIATLFPWKTVGMPVHTDSTALLHMCSASNEWEIAEKQNLQKRA